MTTASVSNFADLETLPWDNTVETPERADHPIDIYTFCGSSLVLGLRPDIQANQFLVTGILRGIAGNLQFARVSAEDKLDDMQARAKERMQNGVTGELDHPESEGLTDAQQIFADSLLTQLEYIEDLFVDIRAFWAQSNDNPEFKLLNRSDIEVRQGIRASAERKAAKLASERKAGTVYALNDIEARRQAIAARRSYVGADGHAVNFARGATVGVRNLAK